MSLERRARREPRRARSALRSYWGRPESRADSAQPPALPPPPAVAAAEQLVRWASAVAAAHRPGATLAINCIGDVDDAVAAKLTGIHPRRS